MDRFHLFGRDLRGMTVYLLLAAVFMGAGIYMGYRITLLHSLLDAQLAQLGNTADYIGRTDHPTLLMFVVIFINNTLKSFMLIGLGALLGLFPILFLWFNGLVIGYLLIVIEGRGESIADIVLRGILPHGILEIPLILLAAAYGMKFGVLVLQALNPFRQKDRAALFQPFFRIMPALLLTLTIGLLAAALIETLITPYLLSGI